MIRQGQIRRDRGEAQGDQGFPQRLFDSPAGGKCGREADLGTIRGTGIYGVYDYTGMHLA